MRVNGISLYKPRKKDSARVNQLRNVLAALQNLENQLSGLNSDMFEIWTQEAILTVACEIEKLRRKNENSHNRRS